MKLDKYDVAIRNRLYDKRDANSKAPYSDIDYENMRSKQRDPDERIKNYFSDSDDNHRIAAIDIDDPDYNFGDEEDLYEAPMKLTEGKGTNFGYSDESDEILEQDGKTSQKWIKKASTNFGMISDSVTSDVDDGITNWKSYDSAFVHPETPDWLKIEIYNAKKASVKTRRRAL